MSSWQDRKTGPSKVRGPMQGFGLSLVDLYPCGGMIGIVTYILIEWL